MSQTSITLPNLLPAPSQASVLPSELTPTTDENVLPPGTITSSEEITPQLKMITSSQSSIPRTEIHKSETSIRPLQNLSQEIDDAPVAPEPDVTNEMKPVSSEASVETLSSGYQPSENSQKGIFFLISRRVTIAYGPYMVLGVLDYRTERFEGLMKALKKMGGEPILKPSYHYNIVRVWHLEKEIFTCAITDLQFCGDGDMDKLCIRAARALDRSARRAHRNLKHRYKLRLHLNLSCPCHPDYNENRKYQRRQSRPDESKENKILDSMQHSKLTRVKLDPRRKNEKQNFEDEQSIDDLSQHSGSSPTGSIPKTQYSRNQPIEETEETFNKIKILH